MEPKATWPRPFRDGHELIWRRRFLSCLQTNVGLSERGRCQTYSAVLMRKSFSGGLSALSAARQVRAWRLRLLFLHVSLYHQPRIDSCKAHSRTASSFGLSILRGSVWLLTTGSGPSAFSRRSRGVDVTCMTVTALPNFLGRLRKTLVMPACRPNGSLGFCFCESGKAKDGLRSLSDQ